MCLTRRTSLCTRADALINIIVATSVGLRHQCLHQTHIRVQSERTSHPMRRHDHLHQQHRRRYRRPRHPCTLPSHSGRRHKQPPRRGCTYSSRSSTSEHRPTFRTCLRRRAPTAQADGPRTLPRMTQSKRRRNNETECERASRFTFPWLSSSYYPPRVTPSHGLFIYLSCVLFAYDFAHRVSRVV